MKRRTPNSSPLGDHAVIVSFGVAGTFGTVAERAAVLELGERLGKAVVVHGVGVLDGDGFGRGQAGLYFYGPDAQRLSAVIERAIAEAGLAPALIVRRFGDVGAREVRVSWDKDGQRHEEEVRPRRARRVPPARIGDVVELVTPVGLAYAQYTHDDETYGELVRAIGRAFQTRPAPDSLTALVAGPTAFHAFVFLQDAVKRGHVAVLGSYRVPDHARPFPVFRDGLPNPRTRKVDDWVLWDGKRQWSVAALTDDQRKLPLRRILSIETLGSRIAKGWRPEQDPT